LSESQPTLPDCSGKDKQMRTLRPTRTIDLRKRRRWYDGEGDSGTPPTPPPPDPKKGKEPPAEITLTQAEFDAKIGNRVKEAKSTAVNDLVKELGFENADALKTMIADAKKRADAEKTDIDRANDVAQQAQKERDELKAQLDTEKQARLIDRRNNAIAAAASKAHNPQDVILWAESDGKEHLEKVVKDDGSIDDAAVKALVAACQKAKSYLFGVTGPGSPSNRDGRPPSADAERIQKALEQRPKVRL
jgi:hypothetical protein